MEKISVYKTNDGKTFEKEKDAINHENFIKVQKWYDQNKLYGNYAGSYVDFKDLIEWIQENPSEVRTILGHKL